MNVQTKYIEMKQESRNRIMKALLVTALVLLALEILMYFVLTLTKLGSDQSPGSYFLYFTVMPTCCNFMDLGIAWLLIKKSRTDKVKDYAVFGCLYGFCANLNIFHSFFLIMPAMFVVPVIVSSMFDNLRYTRFLSVVSAALVIAFAPLSILLDTTWPPQAHWVGVLGTIGLVCIVQYISTCVINFSQSKNGLISNSQQVDSLKAEAISVDPLTGFYNHTAFFDILSKTRANCVESNTIMTVALVDIDDFTAINDSFGHKNGDLVLAACAESLIKFCGVQSTLFRYGGDKFAAIFRGMTDKEVLGYMNEIRETLLARKFTEMPDITIHASCGITEYHGESLSTKEIVESLLQAVAKAKSTGGNRSVINRQ